MTLLIAALLLAFRAPALAATPEPEPYIAFRILHTSDGEGEILPCG